MCSFSLAMASFTHLLCSQKSHHSVDKTGPMRWHNKPFLNEDSCNEDKIKMLIWIL